MGEYFCICTFSTIDLYQRNTLEDSSFLSTDQDNDEEDEDEANPEEAAEEAEGEDEADDEVERNDVARDSSKFRRIVKNILSENEQDRKKAYNEATSATLQDIASLLLLSTGDNMKKKRIYEEIIRKVE